MAKPKTQAAAPPPAEDTPPPVADTGAAEAEPVAAAAAPAPAPEPVQAAPTAAALEAAREKEFAAVCSEPFTAFGKSYVKGQVVPAADMAKWNEGDLQRRVQNGFVKSELR